jgi:hypothetical protein
LGADSEPDFLLDVLGKRAVLDEQQHHIGAHLLRPQRRDTDRHLDQFVEVVGNQEVVFDPFEMPPHRVFDHVVVGRDHEGGVLQEEKEANGFQGGDRGLG